MLIGTICFLLPVFPKVVQPAPSEIVFALTGVVSATNYIIPYSIIGETTSKADSGRFIALLNTTQVCAQMVANFLASVVMQLTGSVTYGIGMQNCYILLKSITNTLFYSCWRCISWNCSNRNFLASPSDYYKRRRNKLNQYPCYNFGKLKFEILVELLLVI